MSGFVVKQKNNQFDLLMTSATYQTKVPSDLIPYCEAMGFLFGEVERHLYKALLRGEKLNTLKKEYQIRFGINARQFNSVHSSIKGKIESLKECHKCHIKELTQRLKELEKTIKKLTRRLKSTQPACSRKGKSPRKLIAWKRHQKKRKLASVQHKLEKIKAKKPTLIFGGKKLWKAQFNLEANGYESHEQWLNDWHDARSSQFMLVGSKDETNGCQNCQLTPEGRLKIRVAPGLEHLFGKYIVTEGIHFNYGQEDINYALEKGQALTYRFVRKQGQWYIFCTTQRPEVPTQSRYSNGVLGVDLNPSVIGWAVCDKEGNLKDKGQIRLNLNDRSTEQIEATLGDAVKQLVEIASSYGCPIAVEHLDFSKKKTQMKEQGVRYSRMLSNFSYAKFLELLNSRTQRLGIELIQLNPAYSSFIGMAKFMPMYGLSSDTAAAFVLARRAIRKSERVPAFLARFLPEDRSRHSWSYWNSLKKKFGVMKRHDFFDFSAANSGMVVTPIDESVSHSH
jgi:IS605 OrfB family transposase